MFAVCCNDLDFIFSRRERIAVPEILQCQHNDQISAQVQVNVGLHDGSNVERIPIGCWRVASMLWIDQVHAVGCSRKRDLERAKKTSPFIMTNKFFKIPSFLSLSLFLVLQHA